MCVKFHLGMGLALTVLAVAVSAQQGQMPTGSTPVGQQQVSPSPAGGAASLPPPSPAVGGPIPQQQLPQNLPPLPAGALLPAEPNFEDVMSRTLGLTPEQIRELRRQQNVRQRAASELPMPAPKQVMGSVNASPSPGSVPPVIRLFPGFASALTFVDSTGALWPMENYAIGHDKMFDVKRMDGEKGSMLSIAPMGTYAQTNLLVYLRGLSSPIVITFISGQRQVDLRTDVRVQGLGPNAQVAVGGLPASTNPTLFTLLEGVAPPDSKELRVVGGDGRAWLSRTGLMYLRTPMRVISPNWIGSTRSADGTSAYEMKPANSIRVLREGRIETVGIEGF